MKTIQKVEEQKEKTILLKQCKAGDTIRFPKHTFEEALKENLFYYVLEHKDRLTTLVCLETATMEKRDGTHDVVVHDAELLIVKH